MQVPGLVSVIIPTWNRQHELPVAIRSVLNQTYRNVEVLVCDDGSTDGSLDAVTRIGDARVRWIDGVHAGLPSVPRNRGMQAARGQWIAFLDSDDTWLPEKLALQLARLAKSNGVVLASCGNALRRTDTGTITGDELLLAAPAVDSDLPLHALLQSNAIITSTVLLHRSLLSSIASFPTTKKLKVGEDYAFWLRVASLTPFAFHCAALASYRDIPQASVRAATRSEALGKLHVYSDYFAWLATAQPGRLAGIALLSLFLEGKNALLRKWWRLRGRLGLLKQRLHGRRR